MTNREMLRRFDSGMRVKVSDRQLSYTSKSSRAKVERAYGTVRYVDSFYEKIWVEIDDEVNKLSGSGCFFFKPLELDIVDENNNIMEENTMANITNYLNIAKIKFLDERGGRTWDYANFDASLRPRDICVVMTANHGMTLAEVVDILPRNDIETSREIVAKVDMDYYNERVNARKQAAEIKAKMQERAKKLQDIALFQMLAKEDSEMMDLLNRYQSLPQF